MEPLHAYWLAEFYNNITSESGLSVVTDGWKATGIFNAIKMGSADIPSLDPFQEISPLLYQYHQLSTPSPKAMPNDLCLIL